MTESQMPSAFDRSMDSFKDNQAAVKAGPSQKRIAGPFGLGNQLWSVETYRIDGQDTIFLECYGDAGQVRLVIPPAIARIVVRQYDALGGKSRRRAAAASAQERKDAGIEPAFLKGKRS